MEMIDGEDEEGESFYSHFNYGFAAGITLYTDKRREGMPLYVSEDVDELFYPYDIVEERRAYAPLRKRKGS
jgi:hypothetical protein